MPGITLLGLGPGDPHLLTRQAWQALEAAAEIYLRTRQHPVVDGLPVGLMVHSFDDLSESSQTFEETYNRIVEQVLALGRRPQGVLYAVPGDPAVGELFSAPVHVEPTATAAALPPDDPPGTVPMFQGLRLGP